MPQGPYVDPAVFLSIFGIFRTKLLSQNLDWMQLGKEEFGVGCRCPPATFDS